MKLIWWEDEDNNYTFLYHVLYLYNEDSRTVTNIVCFK